MKLQELARRIAKSCGVPDRQVESWLAARPAILQSLRTARLQGMTEAAQLAVSIEQGTVTTAKQPSEAILAASKIPAD